MQCLLASCHVRWEQKGSVCEIPFPAQCFISPCQNILYLQPSSLPANFWECVTNSDKTTVDDHWYGSLRAPFSLLIQYKFKSGVKIVPVRSCVASFQAKSLLIREKIKTLSLLLHLPTEIRDQTELKHCHTHELKSTEALTVSWFICTIQCDNDLIYNSRQYQPSGVIAFVVFPSLHYRKLQKQANTPNTLTELSHSANYGNKTQRKQDHLR